MELNVESDQTLLLAVADEPRVFFSGVLRVAGRKSRKRGIFVAATNSLSSDMQYPHAADLKAATLNFTV